MRMDTPYYILYHGNFFLSLYSFFLCLDAKPGRNGLNKQKRESGKEQNGLVKQKMRSNGSNIQKRSVSLHPTNYYYKQYENN